MGRPRTLKTSSYPPRKPFHQKITQDKIVTIDHNTHGRIITTRGRLSGQTETEVFGDCSKEIIQLHAQTVQAKWKRPSETEILSNIFRP